MSEEERNLEMQDPEADITTEEPAPRAPEEPKKWKMPEPVFRQTSGYLPQGFQKRYPAPAVDASNSVPAPAPDPFAQTFVGKAPTLDEALTSPPAEPSVPAIEEQPDIPEVLVSENAPEEAAPVEAERSGSRVWTIFLVALAVAAFALLFLAIVVVLFFPEMIPRLSPSPDLN